jgi:hypothetical protein
LLFECIVRISGCAGQRLQIGGMGQLINVDEPRARIALKMADHCQSQ